MELRHLRYFVQVAEDLHFARAAARLGISQPPLSLQIRQLEEMIGVRLLDRTSRRVALTAAGTVFLQGAKRVLAEAENAVSMARDVGRGEKGELRIGFNASAPFVPQVATAINTFRSRYPEVRLALSEVAGAAQVDAILGGGMDVGFLRSAAPPILPPSLVATCILTERLMLATSPDHPLAGRCNLCLAEAAAYPLVVYGSQRGGAFTEELFALIRAAGAEPHVVQKVQEVSTLLGLVAAGIGITVVAQSLGALRSDGLVYTQLSDADAVSAIWMVHASAAAPTAANFAAVVTAAGRM